MQSLQLAPEVADLAPAEPNLTTNSTPSRTCGCWVLIAEGIDWREVTRIVLQIDPDHDVQRARRGMRSRVVIRGADKEDKAAT